MAKFVQRIRKFARHFAVTPAISLALSAVLCGACWDTIQHVYACDEDAEGTGQCTMDTSTSTQTDTETAEPSSTESHSSETIGGQGVQPAGWEGFGSPCDDDVDCQNINPNFVCIHNVIDLINAPGGYCTACCNESGKDKCAPGIDCVGADGVYLVCLTHCTDNRQCRTEMGWECREIYYIPDEFPGQFCLPDSDHVTPDTEYQGEMPNCDWPW